MTSAAATIHQPLLRTRKAERPRGTRFFLQYFVGRAISFGSGAVGFVLGFVLGPLFALLTAFGLWRLEGTNHLLPGPGAWVAGLLRRRLSHSAMAVPVAATVGVVAGLFTGPIWFDVMGWNLGKFLGEGLACRLFEVD